MKKNGFAGLIIILVIAILGVVGYFIYQNFSFLLPQKTVSSTNPVIDSTDTVSIPGDQSKWIAATQNQIDVWKTYTDKTKLFSIYYPTEWNVSESGSTTILTPDPPCTTCTNLPSGIRISIIDNKDNLSAKDYVTKNVVTSSGSISKDQPGFFENIDAILVEGQTSEGTSGPTTYIRDGNKMIVLASNGLGNDILVGQIFYTFMFLEPQP